MDLFQFGNITLKIDCPIILPVDERMELFRVSEISTDQVISLNIKMADFIMPSDAVFLWEELHTAHFMAGSVEIARYSYPHHGVLTDLMWMVLYKDRPMELYIHPDIDPMYLTMHELLKHMELVAALISRDVWILHSCYIKTDEGAVLFTANSGVGKSTQGKLWERYGGASIINEDRALVFHNGDGFYAGGFVYSGSSKICENETMKVRAIVLVRQGNENRVIRTRAGLAIKFLYMQLVSSNYRDEDKLKKMDFAERLFRKNEVLTLTCRPDADAVMVLKDYLMSGGYDGT